jgi:transcriptional regulator with XRE-family HTH domain
LSSGLPLPLFSGKVDSVPPQTRRRGHGPTIRAIRLAKGLTLQNVADRSGLSTTYLSDGEKGKAEFSERATQLIAAALEVDAPSLTGQIPAIRALREALGIKKRDLADQLAIRSTRLDLIEAGTEQPDPRLAALIAVRLGVPVTLVGAGFAA